MDSDVSRDLACEWLIQLMITHVDPLELINDLFADYFVMRLPN